MNLLALQKNEQIGSDGTAAGLFSQISQIHQELQGRDLPPDLLQDINAELQALNDTTLSGKPLEKFLKKTQTQLLKLLEKHLKLVPMHHYRAQWMVMGMSAFGLPLGVAFGLSIGNIGLLGIGLPIGMAIGIGVGTSMDTKAKNEGRQLNVTIKY